MNVEESEAIRYGWKKAGEFYQKNTHYIWKGITQWVSATMQDGKLTGKQFHHDPSEAFERFSS